MPTDSKNEIQVKVNQVEPDTDIILHLIETLAGKKGNLIPLLQGVQNLCGYLPENVIRLISAHTGHSVSSIYGVASFYSQFRLHPVGRHIIRVCHGTACHVQNANSISKALREELNVDDGGTTDDRLFTLETVACLGCCSLAPVMMIGEETYGNLTPAAAVKIIRNIRKAEGGGQ